MYHPRLQIARTPARSKLCGGKIKQAPSVVLREGGEGM